MKKGIVGVGLIFMFFFPAFNEAQARVRRSSVDPQPDPLHNPLDPTVLPPVVFTPDNPKKSGTSQPPNTIPAANPLLPQGLVPNPPSTLSIPSLNGPAAPVTSPASFFPTNNSMTYQDPSTSRTTFSRNVSHGVTNFDGSTPQQSPICDEDQAAWSNRYQKSITGNTNAANDIQNAVAEQGGPSAEALANKALAQVSCPPHSIGLNAGVCALNGHRASSSDCAYYVRKALEGTLLGKNVGGLGDAKYMGCGLKKAGLRNLCPTDHCSPPRRLAQRGVVDPPTCALDPYKVPVGSVLIYDNVPGQGCHPAGHAEIRTENGFVSDYFSTHPRSEVVTCRRLIGIWVK